METQLLPSNMQSMLDKINNLKSQAENLSNDNKHNNFSDMLNQALGSVNQLQNKAHDYVNRFEMGENLDLSEVMINTQKASVAFQALVEVRNKMVNAYQEIMNMAI